MGSAGSPEDWPGGMLDRDCGPVETLIENRQWRLVAAAVRLWALKYIIPDEGGGGGRGESSEAT